MITESKTLKKIAKMRVHAPLKTDLLLHYIVKVLRKLLPKYDIKVFRGKDGSYNLLYKPKDKDSYTSTKVKSTLSALYIKGVPIKFIGNTIEETAREVADIILKKKRGVQAEYKKLAKFVPSVKLSFKSLSDHITLLTASKYTLHDIAKIIKVLSIKKYKIYFFGFLKGDTISYLLTVIDTEDEESIIRSFMQHADEQVFFASPEAFFVLLYDRYNKPTTEDLKIISEVKKQYIKTVFK